MKIKTLNTIVLLFCIYFMSYGQITPEEGYAYDQNVSAKSYNDFSEKTDRIINYHTGTINISIALHNIKINEFLDIPISINYNTGGIKVPERPGPIGLGWDLNAGGYIRREIRGRSDDGSYMKGTWKICNFSSSDKKYRSPTFDELKSYRGHTSFVRSYIFSGLMDLESDVYHFSFGQINGRFIIDKDGNPRLIDQQNIMIKKNIVQENLFNYKCSFTIFDEKGNEYQFNKSCHASSAHQYKRDDRNNAAENDPNYWLSEERLNNMNYDLSLNKVEVLWHLTRVICHQTNQSIDFEYYTDNESYKIPANTSINFYLSEAPEGIISPTLIRRNYEGLSDLRKLRQNNEFPDFIHINAEVATIKSISSPYEKVIFNRSSVKRLDLTDQYSIESIEIKDLNNTTIRTFNLSQSYFDSQVSDNTDTNLCKRLKLDKITETNGISAKPPYVFFYDEENKMPDRNAYSKMDYYGYSINPYEDNQGMIPNTIFKSTNYSITKNIGIPCNRTPIFPAMQAFALNEIEYPTGGRVRFIFEANEYYDENTSSNVTSGGLRIKTTIESSSNGNDIVTNFSYNSSDNPLKSSGSIGSQPQFYREIKDVSFEPYTDIWMMGSIWPVNEIGTSGGSHIGYSEITEIKSGNGKIVRNYTSFKDRPDTENNEYFNLGLGSELPTDFGYNTFILPKTTLNEERGLLTSINYYNNEGQLIKKIVHSYDFNYMPTAKFLNENAKIILSRGNAQPLIGYGFFHPSVDFYILNMFMQFQEDVAFIGRYYDVSKMIKLISTIEYNYSPNEEFRVEKYFTYNDLGLLSSESTINSDGSKASRYYKYISDYVNYLSDFKDGNILCETSNTINLYRSKILKSNFLVETINTVTREGSENVISGVINTYKTVKKEDNTHIAYPTHEFNLILDTPIPYNSDFSSKIVSTQINNNANYAIQFNSNYSPKLIFDSYDSNLNLLQYHENNDVNYSFIWGQKNSKVIIEGVNVSNSTLQSAVVSALNSAGLESIEEIEDPSQNEYLKNKWKSFNSLLRSNPSLSQSSLLTYTYKPLIGTTSKTDQNGITSYYIYDIHNRLSLVKDNDGNVLRKYDYHYSDGN